MQAVSAVVLTKNEEVMLPACLARLAWCDEMLVVDSGSTDRTVDLARAAGARVLEHSFEGFASQFNWAASQAAHDWVLLVDADEILDDRLVASLQATLAGPPEREVYLARRDGIVFGHRMRASSWSREYVPRLFRKGVLTFHGGVHQHYDIGGRVPGRLDGCILHYTYRSVGQYFAKLEHYTTLWAADAHARGRRLGWVAAYLSSGWRFFHNYFLRGEILDGRVGLFTATASVYYTYSKYMKLWGLNHAATVGKLPEVEKVDKKTGTTPSA